MHVSNYIPPDSYNVDLNFNEVAGTVDGHNVVLNFGANEVITASIDALISTAFLADSNDKPQQIFGAPGKRGLWELDGEQFVDSITVPRWPADVIPASGSDGHADIVDPFQGVIHSFLRLRKDKSGRWTADMYAWTRLDGRGWGDPAHYYQGARAAAVPPMAGVAAVLEGPEGPAGGRVLEEDIAGIFACRRKGPRFGPAVLVKRRLGPGSAEPALRPAARRATP